MRIFLIRHTKVDITPAICYGRSDLPLAASFAADFQEVFSKLAPNLLELETRIYSSPLQRCLKLAQYLHKYLHKYLHSTPLIDTRLLEYNFGKWEMQPWQAINDHYAQRWFADYVNIPAPEGENYRAMGQRVADFYQEIITSDAEQLIVISHAGVIRLLLAQILQMPLELSFNLSLDYGGVSLVERKLEHSQIHYINR